MQELEKIMKEIEQRKVSAEKLIVKPAHDKLDQIANDTAEAFIEAYKECQDIIRKHMSGKDTDVTTNDGWISVEERLPDESLNSVIGWDEYRERCCFVQYYAGKWALRVDREPIKITHWRPLPGRPGRSKGE